MVRFTLLSIFIISRQFLIGILSAFSENYQKLKYLVLHLFFIADHTVCHCKEGPLQTCIRENSSSHNFGKDEKLKHEVKSFAVNLCSMMSKACNLSQFKNVMFIFYLISNVLISFSLLIPFIFLYDRAIEMGIDTASAKWLGAIIGITNTVGRVFSGILADKLKINKIMLFSSAIIVVGVSTAICPLCTNFTWLVAFSCVFGLSYGKRLYYFCCRQRTK
jgi:hypothetical protein